MAPPASFSPPCVSSESNAQPGASCRPSTQNRVALESEARGISVLSTRFVLAFAFSACLGLVTCLVPAHLDAATVSFEPDGKAVLENALVRITVSNKVGGDHGIVSWRMKPQGRELIDVLYGQTDYLKGHALGELFDPVSQGSRTGGAPKVGKIYTPERRGTLADGTAVLQQAAEDEYRITRTLTLADGAAFLLADYKVENVRGPAVGFAMRFHTVWSPGNDGKTQSLEETIVLPSSPEPVSISQDMGVSAFREAFGSDRFFSGEAVALPKPEWAHNPSKRLLSGNWALHMGRRHSAAFVYTVNSEAFAGYYNALTATLEPLLKPVVLAPGESFNVRVSVGSLAPQGTFFTPASAAGFFLFEKAPAVVDGQFQAAGLPLFDGTLEVRDQAGKMLGSVPVSTGTPVRVVAPTPGGHWTLAAKNERGDLLASIDASGTLAGGGRLPDAPPRRPAPERVVDVREPAAVRRFLEARDFRVYCPHDAPELQRAAARRIAGHLGVGLEWSEPRGKVLALGDPKHSPFVRDGGKLRDAVDSAWPGPGRGVVSFHENLELTTAPVLFVAGSDERGAAEAVALFEKEFVLPLPRRTGFAFWTAPVSERIYANAPAVPDARGPIRLRAARGEVESAQAVLTAFEDLKGVDVSATPLLHETTGKEIDNKQVMRVRQVHGPLRIRWVESFPLKPENGWTGHPDALLDRPEQEIAAGKSQTLWLTFAVSENAQPGVYRSVLSCRANGGEQQIPIELTVRPFVIPRTGIPGDPYITLKHLPPDEQRDLKDSQVSAFVQNMVDHGMRYIHLGHKDMIRWHLDPSGGMKGAKIPGMEVSEDGVLAMDASRFDDLVRKIDVAAKPFDLQYMIYSNAVVDDAWSIQRFRKELPTRHAHNPPRGGNDMLQNYYVEEMYNLFRVHMEKNGWIGRITVKISDEPASFDIWWDNMTVAARQARLPVITAFNSIDFREASKGVDALAQWQVIYMKHDAALQKAVQAAGHRYGWYNCGPPPRIANGAPLSEIKGYLWQAAKADLDFICWWGIQNWESHHNTWFNRYSHWNSVTYPPHPFKPAWLDKKRGQMDAVLLDSIRWELIREGLEDTAYVKLLREEIARAEQSDRKAAAAEASRMLGQIWEDLLPDLNHYAPPVSSLDSAREQIAAAIEKLQAGSRP